MESNTTKRFLIDLCNETSISGYETNVAKIIKTEFEKYCDNVYIDTIGNVIAHKKPSGKSTGKIMFAAHLDEIGLMVSSIDNKGFVRFYTVGGYDHRTLLSQEVIIYGKEQVYGVIGIKPPHLSTSEDMKKAIKINEMYIDTGYDYEDVLKKISIGDLICIKRSITPLRNNIIAGRGLDDKAGVSAIYEAMKLLEHHNTSLDVYFVATTQEEIGIKGARIAAYTIQADIGIAIDVGWAHMVGLDELDTITFGKGPAIGIGPNIHYTVYDELIKTSKTCNINHQIQPLTKMSHTDAMFMQTSGRGMSTGVVSIPLKYMHTSVETINMEDILETGKLLASFIQHLDGVDLEELLCCLEN